MKRFVEKVPTLQRVYGKKFGFYRSDYAKLLPFCHDSILRTIYRLEKKLGRPPYMREVITEWNYFLRPVELKFIFGFHVIIDLYTNDQILANYNVDQFSVN